MAIQCGKNHLSHVKNCSYGEYRNIEYEDMCDTESVHLTDINLDFSKPNKIPKGVLINLKNTMAFRLFLSVPIQSSEQYPLLAFITNEDDPVCFHLKTISSKPWEQKFSYQETRCVPLSINETSRNYCASHWIHKFFDSCYSNYFFTVLSNNKNEQIQKQIDEKYHPRKIILYGVPVVCTSVLFLCIFIIYGVSKYWTKPTDVSEENTL